MKNAWQLMGLMLLAGQSVMAQMPTEGQSSDYSLALGVAAVAVESIYLGGDSQITAFPAVDYKYKRFYFQGGNLGLHLIEGEAFELDLGIGANLAGDEDRGDSDRLDGMPDLSIPVNVFLQATHRSNLGLLELQLASEINNKHDGHSASLSYSIPWQAGRWLLLPEVSVNHFSDEAINYFYGVDAESVAEGRPLYQASSDQVFQAGVTGFRPLDDRWTFFANLSVNSYGDEITDSPIVDEDGAVTLFAGITYKVF